MNVLLLESDRLIAKCISDELKRRNIKVYVATSADLAIKLADAHMPSAVISELSLPSHSGTEFLYEFRTYSDWRNTPIVIYSSMKPANNITQSKDWQLLGIKDFLYKPDTSIQTVAEVIESIIEQS